MSESKSRADIFGMWLFLASELLLFGGLITLYSACRTMLPALFSEGIAHNLRWVGSLNTFILIASSFTVAFAVHSARHFRPLLAATFLLGFAFLGLKTYEYADHLAEGIAPGVNVFYSLYYVTTGAHAIHVIIGLIVIAVLFWKAEHARVELGALYWHLVDVIWIFLWPLYYLTDGGRG